MATTIVISGHGNFATGVGSSVELIAGKNPGVEYVDFTEEDTDITLQKKVTDLLKKSEGSQVLFICDIVGGTPFKVCASLANSSDNMEAAAGCNVGAIVEAVLLKDTMSALELANFVVSSTKQSVAKFEKVIHQQVNTNVELEEGI